MYKSTVFKNFKTPVENKSLLSIFEEIKNGKYRDEIGLIRQLLSENKKEAADIKKKLLLGFTPSATFSEGRKSSLVDTYSQIIVLDLDKLSDSELERVRGISMSSENTFCCFTSPSGNGLKIFIKVNSGLELHEIAYRQVSSHYEKILNTNIDKSGKDVSRLCFYSFDEQLYINEDCSIFNVSTEEQFDSTKEQTTIKVNENECHDKKELFKKAINFTNRKLTYVEGYRNNYIFFLASNCNRYGINEAETLELILQSFDLNPEEIKSTVSNVYFNHNTEFAKFANSTNFQSHEKNNTKEDFLKTTPTIPDELYQKMPFIIKEGASVFTEEREKDVYLTGALAILSGCLPKVKGIYDRQEVFPNLFSFAIAPAASGKGALTFAKMLADKYHLSILKKSRDLEQQYKQELSEHKQKINAKKKGDTSTEEEPAKPAFKVLYIPANTSYAKILFHLEQNEGSGIICETEADTLAIAFKKDWGGYSDMLRKSFHHEKLSSSKKTNDEYIEVNNPRLSIALSGTPSQVAGLIASSEDGLFSRFLFYVFKVEQKWKSVSPDENSINLTEHFKNLSNKVFELAEFLEREETIIELSQSQWVVLNSNFEEMLNETTLFTSEDAGSIVKRLGLIHYRISMIFTAMRKFENGESATKLICTDEDFNTALELVKIYLKHSILMFNNLPKQSELKNFKGDNSKRIFIDALPNEFTRKLAVEIGIKYQLSESTVSHLLPRLVGKYFTQIKAGHYKKVEIT